MKILYVKSILPSAWLEHKGNGKLLHRDIYVLENVEGKAFASQELTSGDLILFENVDVGDFDNDGDGKWTEEVFVKDPTPWLTAASTGSRTARSDSRRQP